MYRFLLCLSLLFFVQPARSQVLISLILGDELNSGKVEFGLDGGLNYSSLEGIDSKSERGFHLGFYFDIKMKNPRMKFHTGVIVKSPMGADDIPKYSTGNLSLDSMFADGKISRNLRCFNVPFMLKYKFKHIYAEGGIQLGLIYKAFDRFETTFTDGQELEYKIENKNLYRTLDAGLIGGIGWRFDKGYGLNLGVRYYYGLLDIMVDDAVPDVFNRSLYFAIGIPIGVGKAMKKAEAKQKAG